MTVVLAAPLQIISMNGLVALIFCMRFLSAVGSDSPTCRTGHGDENLLQGFDTSFERLERWCVYAAEISLSNFSGQFLKDDKRLYLKMTSLLLEETYSLPAGIAFRCISATTSNKDSTAHTVLETVDYKNGSEGDWEQFSQSFQFLLESGRYDRMTIIDKNGAPSGSYTFLFAVRECAVVKVEDFGKSTFGEADAATDNAAAAAPAEQRAEETEGAGSESVSKPHCMIWAEDAAHHATEVCCEQYFNQHCEKKKSEYEYTPDKCTIPQERKEL